MQQTAIQVKEIAFASYPIVDVDRARRFYETVLNLKPSNVYEHDGRIAIEYELGNATFAIGNMGQDFVTPSHNGPMVALEVAAFDATMAQLQDADINILMPALDTGVCKMAIVLDPDGNALMIHQRTHSGE